MIAPDWSCCGNPKATWDLILRLDYGTSPNDGRFELKSSFLGKTKLAQDPDMIMPFMDNSERISKQVFHRNIIKKVPIGTCQMSCIVGLVEVLPSGNYFSKPDLGNSEKEKNEDASHYLERLQCQCIPEHIEAQLVHKKLYACYLKDDLHLSLCLLNQERAIENHVLVGTLPFRPDFGVRLIHGNELNKDLTRLLVAQKK